MMNRSGKRRKGTVLIVVGLLLIAAALLLAVFNVYDDQRASASVDQVMEQMDAMGVNDAHELFPGEIPDYILNPDMDMPVQTIDGQDYVGTLRIPSLDLVLPVLSSWSYPGLRIAPCRYEGSAYKDDLIIAAHNYPSHFGNLKHLQEGDEVIFTDVDGNEFCYKVAVMDTLMPTAIEEMESGDWDLTLFTCTIGGSYRVTVRCEREK